MTQKINGLNKSVSVIQSINRNNKKYILVFDLINDRIGFSFTDKKIKRKFTAFQNITIFLDNIDKQIFDAKEK